LSLTPAGKFQDVVVLSGEMFDAIEVMAARTGNHKRAAVRMSRLAVQASIPAQSPPGGMSRAEAHMRAGEQWLLADEPAEAVSGFRRAVADGGPVLGDPRVPLARALFQLGRQAEAQALISRLKAVGPADPRTCDLIAELLVERSDLAAALEWATAGVELCLAAAGQGDPADNDESELTLLLRLRYRIRNDLGLPEDRYDALLDEA